MKTFSFFLLFMTACVADPVEFSSTNNNSSEDVGNNSTQDVGNDTTSDIECVPLVECGDGCGKINDGCGGAIECEPCACENGLALETQCGACGLGLLNCSEGKGVCEIDSDLVGLTCDDMVFYKASSIIAGAGTKEEPFSTLPLALAEAKISLKTIVAAEGEVDSLDSLQLENGVNIIGGFDEEFVRNLGTKPKIEVKELVVVTDVFRPTKIKNIDIKALHTNDDTDLPAVGMFIDNSPKFILDGCRIEVADGLNGPDGSDVAAGADGGDGTSGSNEITLRRAACKIRSVSGGHGGSSSCGSGGGSGGRTAGSSATGVCWDTATPGFSGQNQGGAGGAVGSWSGNSWSSLPIAPADGVAGLAGIADITLNGAHGNGLAPTGFRGVIGSKGIIGRPGKGGGGGGGAVGVYAGDGRYYSGASGGGGGAGGCGGLGGQPGYGGQSSIAIIVRDSEGVQILNSSLNPGKGGDGGKGSRGGAGGIGGLGADGGKSLAYGSSDANRDGGIGGNGGKGGAGGAGGDGSGGTSIGIVCITMESIETAGTAVHLGVGGKTPSTNEVSEPMKTFLCPINN